MDDVQKSVPEPSNNTPEIVEERARTESFFLSIGDGAIATNADGKIERINQVALDLIGYAESEVLGQWFPKIFIAQNKQGEPISPLDRPITKAILAGRAITEKTYYLTRLGRVMPVVVTVSPVVLNRKPIGAVEVFRDITEESEVDKMKSEFISIASHQLRTPLTAIKTYSHLLSSGYKGKLNSEQQEFMKIILGSIERMNELINVLLDVSRIEAGRINLVIKKTDVGKLLKDAINELEPEAIAKHIKIDFDPPDKKIVASIDQLLTTEIITNILSNSIKYTSANGKIAVKLDDKTDHLFIQIKDNGYGIPSEIQNRIFTKFFRADNVRQKEPSGSGLGLYMVKQIVESMGGDIWFKSQAGKGTSFFFTLPKEVH